MKLNDERRWCLKQFEWSGWTIGRGNWHGVKKWDKHKAALVKAGYLENDPEYPDSFRITEAGRKALEDKP